MCFGESLDPKLNLCEIKDIENIKAETMLNFERKTLLGKGFLRSHFKQK